MCLRINNQKWKVNILDKVYNLFAPPAYTGPDYIRASTFLQAEDNGKNASSLIEKINEGYKIFMDMETVSFTQEADLCVEKDIVLVADKDHPCTINIDNIDRFFTITSSVSNIRFESLRFSALSPKTDSGARIIFNNVEENGAVHLDSLIVTNCFFYSVLLYRISGDRLYSKADDFSFSYINKIQFNNNTVNNIPVTFCDFADTKFDLVEIKNNTVNNFYFILFNFGTSNLLNEEYAARYQELEENKKEIYVDGNTVINDLDWVQTRVSSLYHTFVLTENQYLLYTNNHVEGLKASINIATYDFYANSSYVESHHNTWKNNLCWAEDKDNNTLMKAKGGGGTKLFHHNTYIIDKEFIQHLRNTYNVSDAGLWVDWYSITDTGAHWEIYNNRIDLAVKFIPIFSSVKVSYMNIHHNHVTALAISHSLIGRHRTELESEWYFKDNILQSTTTEYRTEDTLYFMTAVPSIAGITQISNNIFDLPNQQLRAYTSTTGTNGLDNTIHITNNIFKISRTRELHFADMTDAVFIHQNPSPSGLEGSDDIYSLCGMSSRLGVSERKIKITVDLRKTGAYSRPVYLTFYDGRAVHGTLKIKRTDNTQATRNCLISFSHSADGLLTLYDELAQEYIYQGSSHPETQIAANCCNDLLRYILYPNSTSRIQDHNFADGVEEIEFEIHEEV